MGILIEDSQTYLVADFIDTSERVYFYYGGKFDADVPSAPMGTHFESVPEPSAKAISRATAKPKQKPKQLSPKASTETNYTPPTNQSSAGWFVLLLFAGLFLAVIRSDRKITKARPTSGVPPDQGEDAAVSFTVSISTRNTEPAQNKDGDKFWKSAADSCRVGRFDIGGMLYVGSDLAAVGKYDTEPALIDPKLSISSSVDDCSTRRLNYWPSYSDVSPEARAAYLLWLATGRKDPSADVGYVFLYFYGLERRALHDAKSSETAKSELPAIEKEVQRLLDIYKNRSFQGYAGTFLSLLQASRGPEKSYKNPPPELAHRELSFSHRYALAQCAADAQPLPGDWAYAWLVGDPSSWLRTPAKRCPDEFKKLFSHRYRQEFGEGLILPRNKTQLKLDYRPASPSFGHEQANFFVRVDLPDVSTLSSPMKKLQAIAEECSSDLESYSRVVGKTPGLAGTFDSVVELPFFLWPEAFNGPIKRAHALALQNDGFVVLRFGEFRAWFSGWSDVSRDNLGSVCRAMRGHGLGLEPDPKFGGAIPSDESLVVLFVTKEDSDSTPDARYASAALTLHLAVAVAASDGAVSGPEQRFLLGQLQSWLDLEEGDRVRLEAHLRRLIAEPPKLTGLTKRIAGIAKPARKSLGSFLAFVAQADNQVTPDEVRTLEKIFKLLGLDAKSVYSSVHSAASEPVSIRPAAKGNDFSIPSPPSAKESSFKIDHAKVAALHADSERVSAILGAIFTEEYPAAEPVKEMDPEVEQIPPPDSLLGLEPEYSTFLRVLMARAQWARTDLEDIAKDRGLLLDGAMEHINDAAYARFEKPIFEGEDPVELNPEVLKEMTDAPDQAA